MHPITTRKNQFLRLVAGLALVSLALLTWFNPISFKPAGPVASIWKKILNEAQPLPDLGTEFDVFRPLLPPGEKVTFIMDFPFNPYMPKIDQLYTAQSRLTPVVLTHEPGPRAAIVYCSNGIIANRRMQETGYRLLIPVDDGKAIAIRSDL